MPQDRCPASFLLLFSSLAPALLGRHFSLDFASSGADESVNQSLWDAMRMPTNIYAIRCYMYRYIANLGARNSYSIKLMCHKIVLSYQLTHYLMRGVLEVIYFNE